MRLPAIITSSRVTLTGVSIDADPWCTLIGRSGSKQALHATE